jgi:hypothetical protein
MVNGGSRVLEIAPPFCRRMQQISAVDGGTCGAVMHVLVPTQRAVTGSDLLCYDNPVRTQHCRLLTHLSGDDTTGG